MNHDVFISFSSVNTDVAEKICAFLEGSGKIKCWIAYRDIVPSANYAEQLIEAIESSKLLLLILSEESNKSPQVSREIERAGSKGIPILPLRIENVVLSKSMEYFISSHHWLDAYGGDIENYFPALQKAVESSISGHGGQVSGADTGTRQRVRRASPKGITLGQIFGAGAALTILALGFYLFRPAQNTPVGAPATQALSAPETTMTAASPVSQQDALIRELAERFKENKAIPKPQTDGWTSSEPLSIAFLDISGSGMGNGELDFILNGTGEKLRESKRFAIVERAMIDELLEELNLSSSDLADPATALKLGRILSANLIVTGSLSKQEKQWLASLRFIETETTAIKCSVSTLVDDGGVNRLIANLGAAIATRLHREFPLQGKIISVTGQTAAMNIGSHSGVTQDMAFALLREDTKPLDIATVTSVEQKQSHIMLSGRAALPEEGMLLREQVQE